jgi:hypothetical protein
MSDIGLVDGITTTLRAAGLEPMPLDGPNKGGFAVQPDEDLIYVLWCPSDELSETAFENLTSGHVDHASILHMGTIKHAMAKALLDILVSGGFDARMSTDEMSPATVEVSTR